MKKMVIQTPLIILCVHIMFFLWLRKQIVLEVLCYNKEKQQEAKLILCNDVAHPGYREDRTSGTNETRKKRKKKMWSTSGVNTFCALIVDSYETRVTFTIVIVNLSRSIRRRIWIKRSELGQLFSFYTTHPVKFIFGTKIQNNTSKNTQEKITK